MSDLNRVSLKGYGAAFLACTLWGFSFYLGKLVLREMSPMHLVLGRFLIAVVLFAPIVWRNRPRVERRHFLSLFVVALMTVPANFLLQFEGLARTSATNAALIVGAFPPLQALASVLFHGERPGVRGWLAVAFSTFGVFVMIGTGGALATRVGDLLVLVSLFASVIQVVLVQGLLKHYRSRVITPLVMVIGTAMLIPMVLVREGLPPVHLSGTTWAALVVLGLFCTAATFTLWNMSLQYIPASHAGVVLNLEPLIGAILGITLLGDPLGAHTMLGGMIILSAAVLVAFDKPLHKPVPEPVLEPA